MKTTTFFPSLNPLASRYDAFILDLWGVIHDGKNLYPGVKECLAELRAKDKKIVFLSNAPRRASVAAEALQNMGITHDLYDALVTSGEAAYQCLAHPEACFFKPAGRHYIYMGLERDRNLLERLPYEEVAHPESAQFFLLSHSWQDNEPLADLLPLLERCIVQGLPALCINPDTEIVRLSGERVYCAGYLAEQYRNRGGEVVYFGKPHPTVYEACMRELGGMEKSRILAVGDNMLTDIAGARRNGFASALVTGGVLRAELGDAREEAYETRCKALFARQEMTPDYVIPAFSW